MRDFNILIVDDNLDNIRVIANILKDNSNYNFIYATNGEETFERTKEYSIDLILLDIMMSPMDGYNICRTLKKDANTQEIPIIFISAKSDNESILEGFLSGGVDYISKPFNPYELEARVDNQIRLRAAQEKKIYSVQNEIIDIVATLGEEQSIGTASKHIQRVTQYATLLAELAKLPQKQIDEIQMATPLHDIGKIVIDQEILNKQDKLSDEEFAKIKEHPTVGYEIFKQSPRDLLKAAAIIAHEHHEAFDGSGYPRGIKGNDIHIFGRITAIADVFDVLTTKRAYKDAWPLEKAKEYIQVEAGTKFDPDLVEIFIDNFDKFETIYKKLN
ncbi:MAG: response regulator [Campylobacterales bacterium]|nr:response regulator [Campylobacterales bacterium]